MNRMRVVVQLLVFWFAVCLSVVSPGVMYGAQNADARIPVVLSTDVGNEITRAGYAWIQVIGPRAKISIGLGVITSHFRVGRHLYGAMKLRLAVWEEATR